MSADNCAWSLVADVLPPEGLEVETKIHDGDGPRNETTLTRKGGLWFLPHGSMYVYYRPTHWRRLIGGAA